jgi:thiol:disulfide interchange protein
MLKYTKKDEFHFREIIMGRFWTVGAGVLMTIFIILSVQVTAGENGTVAWQDFEKAKKLAADSGKPMLLTFYAEWCGACKLMEEKTFSDQQVVSCLNEQFIPVRINFDKNRELAQEFRVRVLPTTWFLNADGSRVKWTLKPDQTMNSGLTGTIRPDIFLWLLKYISTKSYASTSFTEYLTANGVEP